MKDSALDLIERLLVYPVENRIIAVRALEHPWFGREGGLLLPVGYPPDFVTKADTIVEEVDGKPLGYRVQQILGRDGVSIIV